MNGMLSRVVFVDFVCIYVVVFNDIMLLVNYVIYFMGLGLVYGDCI